MAATPGSRFGPLLVAFGGVAWVYSLQSSDVPHAEGVELTVYFCCVEALQNAAKHAGPGASATVLLGEDRDGVHFSVEDDGVGFAPDDVEPGGGLTNLADRAASAGGTLRIESAPGRGTRVIGWLPG